MREPGANDELLSLIIVSIDLSLLSHSNVLIRQGSLEDWDDNMQTECAKAFIEVLQKDVGETICLLLMQ